MSVPNIYISVLNEGKQLTIDGSLELLGQLFSALRSREVDGSPRPESLQEALRNNEPAVPVDHTRTSDCANSSSARL